jgi:hypothetical protein
VKKITSIRVGGQKKEHGGACDGLKFLPMTGRERRRRETKMNNFMKMVSEKLGPNAVKDLLLHQDGELLVVFYFALRGEE